MKIIKHGKYHKPEEFAFLCGNCGCYFAAKETECSVDFHNNTFYRTCKCPECLEYVSKEVD